MARLKSNCIKPVFEKKIIIIKNFSLILFCLSPLVLAQGDGSMERLFETYFAEELRQLRSTKNRLFILENNRVPESMRMAEPILINKIAN